MITTIATFDPMLEAYILIFIGLVTILYIADGIANFAKYDVVGKALVILSAVPMIGLLFYGGQYGIWTDEIANVTDTYIQQPVGSDQESLFLIATCLLLILAKSYPKKKVTAEIKN